MFEDFLKEYIKDLIECSSEEYNIDEDKINDIASIVENNEHIWEVIDMGIYNELDNYVKGVDE